MSIRNKHKIYDYDAAYNRIIQNYREGKLGKITLDDPIVVE
jgi:ribosome biogenesis GTPase A